MKRVDLQQPATDSMSAAAFARYAARDDHPGALVVARTGGRVPYDGAGFSVDLPNPAREKIGRYHGAGVTASVSWHYGRGAYYAEMQAERCDETRTGRVAHEFFGGDFDAACAWLLRRLGDDVAWARGDA